MKKAIADHKLDDRMLDDDRANVAANIEKMMAAVSADEEMSDEDFAATEFEAWLHQDGEWTPPTNEEWVELANPHLATIRIAWATLHKTKPELIETIEKLLRDNEEDGQGFITETLDGFLHTSNYLKGLLAIVDIALGRLLVAGMNVSDPDAPCDVNETPTS